MLATRLEEWGKKKWRRDVADVVARLIAALEPDDVVLGGGNVKDLERCFRRLPCGRQRQRISSEDFACGSEAAERSLHLAHRSGSE